MRLHDLRAAKGSRRARHRVGRGESSGWGKTSGRGYAGQKARSGKGKPRRGFEGGQIPMYRRMPKRGFTNIFAEAFAAVNLDTLVKHFAANDKVDLDALKKAGLASKRDVGVRILGRGELDRKLTIEAIHFTASAKQKIEAAGGQAIDVGK